MLSRLFGQIRLLVGGRRSFDLRESIRDSSSSEKITGADGPLSEDLK